MLVKNKGILMLTSHVFGIKEAKRTKNYISHPITLSSKAQGNKVKWQKASNSHGHKHINTVPIKTPSADMTAVLGNLGGCWSVFIPCHLYQDGNIKGHLKAATNPELEWC